MGVVKKTFSTTKRKTGNRRITIQYNTAMQCSTIQYDTIRYDTIRYDTIQYSSVQYSTVQYSTVQHSTVQYSTVQHSTIQYNTIQYNATQYNAIQYNAMQCNTIQCNMVDAVVEHLAIALLFRCSILEPGPVGTSIGENIEAWTEKYDKPTADQKTLELQEAYGAKFNQAVNSTRQDVREVAEIVKNIILSENPNLRYQTNDKFGLDEVKAKLADPAGNVLVEMLNKKYLAKE